MTSASSYSEYENIRADDLSAQARDIFENTLGLPRDSVASAPGSTGAESERFVQEFRLQSNQSDRFEWQLGLFYTKEEAVNQSLVQVELVPPNAQILFGIGEPFAPFIQGDSILIQDVVFTSEFEELAGFVNAKYFFRPDLDIDLGVRYSDTENNTDFDYDGLFVDPNASSVNSATESVTTYRAALSWRVEDTLSLYASVATGYRPGWSNAAVVNIQTGETSDPFIESDELISYELGAKGALRDGELNYDIALWYQDWEDFQSSETFPGQGTFGGNGDATIVAMGFEATVNALLTDSLLIQGTLAYADSELDGDSEQLNGIDGEQTRNLPEWTASLRATYNFPITQTIDGSIVLGLRYTDEFNTAYIGNFEPGLSGQPIQAPIDSILVTDLSTSFTAGNYRVNLYATNLFNDDDLDGGSASSFFVPGVSNARGRGVPLQPRTVGVSLRYSF
ncbi:MAG: TonB-dependent receptor [Pseudomonadota bacterium]